MMIAVHLWTEKRPGTELQATRLLKTSQGGSDAGRELCHVNIARGKKNLSDCSCLQGKSV